MHVVESEEDARLCLVTDDGVISEESGAHVSNTSGETTLLHMNRVCMNWNRWNRLCLENESRKEQILRRVEVEEQLRENLYSFQAELQQLRAVVDIPVEELAAAHKKLCIQALKAKRFWSQKCKQLLLHEAAIKEKEVCIVNKDAEIALL